MKKNVPNPRRRLLAEQVVARSPRSVQMYAAAREHYAGGVVGANVPVYPAPVYIERAEGAYVYDLDGNRYIDCWPGHGTLMFGHGNVQVREAIAAQLEAGWAYGYPHPLQVAFAEKMKSLLPGREQFVLCNSGTEAVHKAIMLARAYTGKQKLVKFSGTYHGTYDQVILNVRAATHESLPLPVEPHVAGTSVAATADTLVMPFNDTVALEALLPHVADITAVVTEPVAGYGLFAMEDGFAAALYRFCQQHNILLIMDEVFMGFRGVAERQADIHTYGKLVGGGMPLGVLATRREILDICTRQTPPLLQGGTFSGNPACLSAACAFLDLLQADPSCIDRLVHKTSVFANAINTYCQSRHYPFCARSAGTAFAIFARPQPPLVPADMRDSNGRLMDELVLRLRLAGVILNITGIGTLTLAHDDEVMVALLAAFRDCLDATMAGDPAGEHVAAN